MYESPSPPLSFCIERSFINDSRDDDLSQHLENFQLSSFRIIIFFQMLLKTVALINFAD